ncbi:MAG: DNA alkylation repair protein [Chitinophagaceae bacterium]|nr:DNA alkylation repair protein [Chitinophagaceae bacterium]
MATKYSITEMFGANLAAILADKIAIAYPNFESKLFIKGVKKNVEGQTYTQRIATIAEQLKLYLPDDYEISLPILLAILGEENPKETGMFTHYYWLMPVGKFISSYGLEHFALSIKGIEEITKRNTGEYAIRPFINKYPVATLKVMTKWAKSPNFHLRRLASEGLRPKLPWAPKLDKFIKKPDPVFNILKLLKEDEVMFVKKSVANHLTDWLKVNKDAATNLIDNWSSSSNKNTQWIIKRATRKFV